MNVEELEQVYYLNREIQKENRKLRRLQEAATNTAASLSATPHGSGISNKTATAEEIADLKQYIQSKKEEREAQRSRLIRYIDQVEDSRMRQMLKERFCELKSWQAIAFSMGGNNKADGVRKAVNRFLRKN